MAFVAIGNGFFRNVIYQNKIPELLAHQISTIILIILDGIVIFFWIRNKKYTNYQLLLVGVFLFILTIVFEFIFGHFVVGHSLIRLLHDYNILEGRIWFLFLLFIFFFPYIINKIKEE